MIKPKQRDAETDLNSEVCSELPHPPNTSSTHLTLPWRSMSKAPPHPHRQMGCFTHVGLLLYPAPVTHLPRAKLNISFTAGIEKGERKNEREENWCLLLSSAVCPQPFLLQIPLGTFSETQTHNINRDHSGLALLTYFIIPHINIAEIFPGMQPVSSGFLHRPKFPWIQGSSKWSCLFSVYQPEELEHWSHELWNCQSLRAGSTATAHTLTPAHQFNSSLTVHMEPF